jgi:RimJ/RimL family protein N-acetyltransferase
VGLPLAPDYPLMTARLLLRPWQMEDLDTYHQLMGDPEVVRYLYGEPLTREQSEESLGHRSPVITEPDRWMNLAVVVSATGLVAGEVGLCWHSDVHRHAEIGYTFLPAHRGQGYATEAAAAMVELAFTALDAHRVSAQLDARNTASGRVLQRLGMRFEGHLVENEFVKGEWTDEAIYAVLDREWPTSEWQQRRLDGDGAP